MFAKGAPHESATECATECKLVPETVKRNLKNKKEEESYLLYLIPYLIIVYNCLKLLFIKVFMYLCSKKPFKILLLTFKTYRNITTSKFNISLNGVDRRWWLVFLKTITSQVWWETKTGSQNTSVLLLCAVKASSQKYTIFYQKLPWSLQIQTSFVEI